MTLSALIRKDGLADRMAATVATVATQETDQPVAIATVATVAVAKQPESLPELSPEEESSIRAWLTHIEETDPAIIAEVMDNCRNDQEARRYFLKQSGEIPKPTRVNRSVHCSDCIHFERIDHRHLGCYAKGELEAIIGW